MTHRRIFASLFVVALSASLASACRSAAPRAPSFAIVPEASDTTQTLTVPLTSGPVLYVLDGRVLASVGTNVPDEVAQLDPARIASVQVLKGSVARQRYGTRGENGVVLIVTRKASDARS